MVLTPNIVEFWRLYEAVGMSVPGDSKATAGAVAQLANKCELAAAASQRETQTNVGARLCCGLWGAWQAWRDRVPEGCSRHVCVRRCRCVLCTSVSANSRHG